MSEINALNRKHDLNHNLIKNGTHPNGKTSDLTSQLNDLSLETNSKVKCK